MLAVSFIIIISNLYLCANAQTFATNETLVKTSAIINGRNAPIGKFPFYVFIEISDRYRHGKSICGGSIISKNSILTSAACAYSGMTKVFKIFFLNLHTVDLKFYVSILDLFWDE